MNIITAKAHHTTSPKQAASGNARFTCAVRFLAGVIGAVCAVSTAIAGMTVSQTSTPNQPPAFSLSIYTGCGDAELTGVYVYEGVVAAPQPQWGSTYVPPGWIAKIPVSWDPEICSYTLNWTETRGLLAKSTYTFMELYIDYNTYWPSYSVATATATVNGPTGNILAYATNNGSGRAALSIRIDNANYGNGITSITVEDPARNVVSNITPIPGPQLLANTYVWTDTAAPAIDATRTLTITARGTIGGYNYQLPVARVPVTSSILALTPLIPTIAGAPAQPRFNIDVGNIGLTRTENGITSAPDYISSVAVSGSNSHYYSSQATSFNADYADPQGSLSAGTYSYRVKVEGYRHVYNSDEGGFDEERVTFADKTINFVLTGKTAQAISYPQPTNNYAVGATFNPGATASSGLPVEYAVIAGNAQRVDPPPAGNGTGLTGVYHGYWGAYGFMDTTRVDPQLNFDWDYGSPISGMYADQFSVKWSGFIEAPESGTFTLFVAGSNWMSLHLEGTQIISGTTSGSAAVSFTAGKRYRVNLDHSGWSGPASAVLSWQSASRAKQPIPTAYLYPQGTAIPPSTQLRITGPGPVLVEAMQPGNASYNPAPAVRRMLNLMPQTITFANPGTRTTASPFSLAASASSALPVIYTIVAGAGTIDHATGMFTPTQAGNVTVRASQGGNSTYDTASFVDQMFTIQGTAQTITFAAPPNKTVRDAPFALGGSASSGLPITYSVSGPGTVDNGILTILAPGTITITASQPGGYNPTNAMIYHAASNVVRTFTVSPMTISPTPISGAISAGGAHVVALKSDGTVWTWGSNTHGQIGDGTSVYYGGGSHRTAPYKVNGLPTASYARPVAIAAGGAHSLVLGADGYLWVWGYASERQLNGAVLDVQKTPMQFTGVGPVVALAAAGNGTTILKGDGTVRFWGNSQYITTVEGLSSVVAIAPGLALKNDGTVWLCGATSTKVNGLNGVVAIALGLALKNDGTVWNVGSSTATQVGGLTGITTIAGGTGHNLAAKSDGTVWAWGSNYAGQLGDGTLVNRSTPVLVSGVTNVVALGCGGTFSVALKNDGTIVSWGRATDGQLGDGMTSMPSTAVQASRVVGGTAIAAGYYYNLVLKNDGKVSGWSRYSSPPFVEATLVEIGGLAGVTSIASGGYHALVRKNDGTVWGWGSNSYGLLGDGTTVDRTTPVQVSGLTGIVAVAASQYHSLALKSDGTVRAWGMNNNGQLGDGATYTYRPTPIQSVGLTGITAIAATAFKSVALKSDGTVWAWGEGRGPTPVLVSGVANAIAVTVGHFLKNDGTVWTLSSPPTQVSGLANMTQIATSYGHQLALKSDGSLWAWGSNSYGKLGDGTTVDRAAPVQVIGASDIIAISAASEHSLALRRDGTVRAWGNTAIEASPFVFRQVPLRLSTSASDTDQDGMLDTWETQHFGNLSRTGGGDFDGEGLTDIAEAARGADPARADTDSDLLTDYADSFVTDPYNGITPTLTVLGGNNQTTRAGLFNAQPFDVAVWNTAGTQPLVGAPVSFAVTEGGGQLATTNTGNPTLSASLSASADEDGTVQAYYKQPLTAYVLSRITATAGPVQLVLNSHSTAAGDADGNGLQDAWELLYFSQIGVNPLADPDGDGLNNGQESLRGTNPNLADTDGDGVNDNQESNDGRDPLAIGDGAPLPANFQLIIKMPGDIYKGVKTDWTIVPVVTP